MSKSLTVFSGAATAPEYDRSRLDRFVASNTCGTGAG